MLLNIHSWIDCIITLFTVSCYKNRHIFQHELRSSLLLSMLKQMLVDDKDDDVREAVVRSLGFLTGSISDADKYSEVCYCL